MSREMRVDEFDDFFHLTIRKMIAGKRTIILENVRNPQELRKQFYEFRYAVRREKKFWPQYWPDIERLSFISDDEGGKLTINYIWEDHPDDFFYKDAE